jgi:upstream activation factor subunit UAF30
MLTLLIPCLPVGFFVLRFDQEKRIWRSLDHSRSAITCCSSLHLIAAFDATITSSPFIMSLDPDIYADRIREIILNSDPSAVTAKYIRTQLEEELQVDFSNHKSQINKLIRNIFDETYPDPADDASPQTSTIAEANMKQEPAEPEASPSSTNSHGTPKHSSKKSVTPSSTHGSRSAKVKSEVIVHSSDEEDTSTKREISDEQLARQLQNAEYNSSRRSSRSSTTKVLSKSVTKSNKSSSSTANGTKSKAKGGYHKACGISPVLQSLLGVPGPIPRTQVTSLIWGHIKANNLQIPENKRKIQCDEKMKAVFKVDVVDMFGMQKLLSKHIFSDVGDGHAEVDSDESEDFSEQEDDQPSKSSHPKSAPSSKSKAKAKASPAKGGFKKVCALSPDLQNLLGVHEPIPRTQVTSLLWAHIKSHDLQIPEDRRKIRCDEKMRAVFKTDVVDMFGMQKLLTKHIFSDDGQAEEDSEEDAESSDDGISDSHPSPSSTSRKRNATSPKSKSTSKKAKLSSSKSKATSAKKGTSVFSRPYSLSPEMALVCEGTQMPRHEVVKRLWKYIKSHNLQDPNNKINILCDENLKKVFGVDRISGFGMNKVIGQHLTRVEEGEAPADDIKEEGEEDVKHEDLVSDFESDDNLSD